MRFRPYRLLAVFVALAALSLAAPPGPPGTSAPADAATTAAKRCRDGKALDKTRKRPRCVRRCPAGTVKKRVKRRLACVRKKPDAPTDPTQTTGSTPPPAPAQIQLTRNDAAGQAAMSAGDLLLERGSCASVTCEYYRVFFYASGVLRAYAVDWNNVSGEICRDGSKIEVNWTFAEGYTYAESGGGVVVKLSTGDVLAFPNAEPNYVYMAINGQFVWFERNPNMRDSC